MRTARNRLRNGMGVEPLHKRPAEATATASSFFRQMPPADDSAGLFPHIRSGAVQGTKSPAESSAVAATPNGYHTNGTINGATTLVTVRPITTTAWDLPELIRPLPIRRQPVRKRPRPLPHYPAVVEYVYKSRFATATQIERRFPAQLRSHRTAQYQLAGLVQAGYLRTAPVRSTSPNFPFVYSATRRGINLVRQEYAKYGISWQAEATEEGRQRGIGLDCILHEVFVTECELAVHRTVENRPDLKCLFTERRYFRRNKRLEFMDGGFTRKIVPDAGFLIRVGTATAATGNDGAASLLLHYFELDNGTMSLVRIAQKLQHYAGWGESDAGQKYLRLLYQRYGTGTDRPNFRLVIVAHANHRPGGDESRLIDLLGRTLDLPAAMRDRIWLTAAEALRPHHNDELPLDAAIWLRARDARPWLAEYQKEIGARDLTSAQKFAMARKFVRERLPELPRHPLFPHRDQQMATG